MSVVQSHDIAHFRRRAPRHALRLTGRFQCGGMTEWMECTVIDISAMGAQIELPHHMIVPSAIRFQIPQDLFEANAIVRHQNGKRTGVEFVSSRREALAIYG